MFQNDCTKSVFDYILSTPMILAVLLVNRFNFLCKISLWFFFGEDKCSHLFLTWTHVNWTAGIAFKTRGTAMFPVPTRDGLRCKTTPLSCWRIQRVAARGVVGADCHYLASLVCTGNNRFVCYLKTKKNEVCCKLTETIADTIASASYSGDFVWRGSRRNVFENICIRGV